MEQLGVEGDQIVITAAARRRSVRRPACGCRCMRVHSRYHRTLADLPWLGRAVVLRVTSAASSVTGHGAGGASLRSRSP